MGPLSRIPRVPTVIAVVTLCAGLAYRYGLDLTADEPFTANLIRLSWPELWRSFAADNVPFYFSLLKLWTSVLGESELALRSLSAFAYAASALLVAVAGARVAGTAGAIAAALLLAASDRMGLDHAATARPYALLCCVAAAATLQSLRLLDTDVDASASARRRGWMFLLVATHVAGMLTHPTYVVIAASSAAAAAVAERRIRTMLVAAPLLAMVTYFVLWGPFIRATISLQTTSWMQPPTRAVVQQAYMLLWGVGPGFILAGALIALVQEGREAAVTLRDRKVVWLVAVTTIAWALPVAVSMWRPIFEATRTPMMLLPPTSLAIAAILSRMGGARAAIGLAVICVAAAGYRSATIPRPDAYPTRASLSAVLGRMQCGDALIAPGLTPPLVTYYFRRLHAAECIQVLSFPSTLLNWERHREPDRWIAIQAEAARLAEERASRPAATWLMTVARGETADANQAIEMSLRTSMVCEEGGGLRGASFDDIIHCVPRGRPGS